MQLKGSLESAYNDQILLEFESGYAYMQLAVDFERRGLPGAAQWMRLQAQEEWGHAQKFISFVVARGGAVRLKSLGAPEAGFASPLAAFERALAHERGVSAAIHELYSKALAENDYASLPLLQWFVTEQVEEENSVGLIVDRLRMIGDDTGGLLFLDRELGSRSAG